MDKDLEMAVKILDDLKHFKAFIEQEEKKDMESELERTSRLKPKKEENVMFSYEITSNNDHFVVKCHNILVNSEDYGDVHISCFVDDEIIGEFWEVTSWMRRSLT